MKPQPKFSVGHRIHWFEYYADMIVKDGGYGTIIDTDLVSGEEMSSFFYYTILKDGGELQKFIENDLEEIGWLEENDESEEE